MRQQKKQWDSKALTSVFPVAGATTKHSVRSDVLRFLVWRESQSVKMIYDLVQYDLARYAGCYSAEIALSGAVELYVIS